MPRPLEYKQRLQALEVPLDPKLFGLPASAKVGNPSVRIPKYQNTKLTGDEGPANEQASTLFTLFKNDKDKPKDMANADVLIGSVHQGVGSASQIVTVLQLVAHYGWKTTYKYFDFSWADIKTRLQTYCERYIGLCCVGFVMGFARDVKGSPLGYVGNISPAQLRSENPPALVDRESLLVWEDDTKSHVALIDDILAPTPDGKTRISIVESIGEGQPKMGLHEDSGTLVKDKTWTGKAKPRYIFRRDDTKIKTQDNPVFVVAYKS